MESHLESEAPAQREIMAATLEKATSTSRAVLQSMSFSSTSSCHHLSRNPAIRGHHVRRVVANSDSASNTRPDLYVEHGQQAVLNVHQILLICHDLCQVFVSLQQHPVISAHLCGFWRTHIPQQMCPQQQCRGITELQVAQGHT